MGLLGILNLVKIHPNHITGFLYRIPTFQQQSNPLEIVVNLTGTTGGSDSGVDKEFTAANG
uniref:Uncharacterized protein n=1 Tax=Oryza sativa subsp. japonica TaxID=39947 RepID=Q33B94_ORYSJ|nr:hypothetical protein LOC_Os10g03940 [Oryza sativa Japonica Group]